MRASSVLGAENDPPHWCVTVFFGLGIPKDMQQEGFNGPLAPLEPFKDKLTMFRNVDMSEARGSGHPAGGTCVFVGEGSSSKERSRSASIEQVMKKELYPDGTNTALGTLAVGSFFRRSHGLYQRIRCWNEDGSRAVEPVESPVALFDRLFGSAPGMSSSGDPDADRARRMKQSVLDSVTDQYRHYTSERAGLSATSKERLRDHLDRIRAIEQRLFDEDILAGCTTPPSPNEPDMPYGFAGATEYDAVKVRAADFQAAFRLNVDMYAIALRCDLVRFGNIMFEASGGHTAFEGNYEHDGGTYSFRSVASDHNNWHESRWDHVRWHSHFFQSNIAYVLQTLDDRAHLEANGNTVFENAMVLIGTETGTNHDMNGVFHAVGAGGNGRFKGLGFYDQEVNAVDIYNTCIHAYGIQRDMGSAQHYNGDISAILS